MADERYSLSEECEAMRQAQKITQLNEWLLDYVAMMKADLEKHRDPVGLSRCARNNLLRRHIAAVTAHLEGR
jgi:hypothetical protein